MAEYVYNIELINESQLSLPNNTTKILEHRTQINKTVKLNESDYDSRCVSLISSGRGTLSTSEDINWTLSDVQSTFSPSKNSIFTSSNDSGVISEDPCNFYIHGVKSQGLGVSIIKPGEMTCEQVAIPVPRLKLKNYDFLTNNVTVCNTVGSNQIWATTSECALHILDVVKHELFSIHSHNYTQLLKPATSITALPIHSSTEATTRGAGPRGTEYRSVLVALESGSILEYSGEINSHGGLKKPLEKPNRYVYLVRNMGDMRINCISYDTNTNLLWIALNRQIKITKKSEYEFKDVDVLHPDIEWGITNRISSLHHSETGTWVTVTDLPCVLLYDSTQFVQKTCVWLCNMTLGLGIDKQSLIISLTYLHDVLFVATQGGNVVAYRPYKYTVIEKSASMDYVCSSNCGEGIITDFIVVPTQLTTTTTNSTQVIVLTGANIYVCIENNANILSSSLVTLKYSRKRNRPHSIRPLQPSELKEIYSVSMKPDMLSPVDRHESCDEVPKLKLISYNRKNTHSILPLQEKSS